MGEFLIVLVVFAGILLIGGWKDIKRALFAAPPPAPLPVLSTLNGTELEQTWARVKRQLVLTNVYEHEVRYQHLYDQANRLLAQILQPYAESVFDPSNVKTRITEYVFHPNSDLLAVRSNLDVDEIGHDTAVALAFYCYLGIQFSSRQLLTTNLNLATRIVDELVAKNHPAAMFLKGLMLKYGLELSAPPNPQAAEKYLRMAKEHGIKEAGNEIPLLWMHTEASRAKAANAGAGFEWT